MASYAFIQKNAGVEQTRLCATDATPPLRLSSGDMRAPADVVVGDLLKSGLSILRVDEIQTS